MSDLEKHIETLAKKAADCDPAKCGDSADAMRYSQAALNLAHALMGLSEMKAREKDRAK